MMRFDELKPGQKFTFYNQKYIKLCDSVIYSGFITFTANAVKLADGDVVKFHDWDNVEIE